MSGVILDVNVQVAVSRHPLQVSAHKTLVCEARW